MTNTISNLTVMLHTNHTIAFAKSGYDVHAKETLNRELQKLK